MVRLMCLATTIAAACPNACGDVYEVRTTSDLRLQLAAPTSRPDVLFWGKSGKWVQAKTKAVDRSIRFSLAVGQMSNGRTTVLVGVPKGVDINDRQPPTVTISLDGQALPAGDKPVVLEAAPKRLSVVVEDAANRIAPHGVRIVLDGAAARAKVLETGNDGKRVKLEAVLPQIEFGEHTLAVNARDASPFRNRADQTLTFRYINTRNVAQAALGAKVRVDSCYPNYGADVLINGDWQSCATSGGPQTTWASAEIESDHWAVIDLPKPQTVESVTLYWVRSVPSQKIEVQLRQGDGWRTVATATPNGSCATTTLRFPQQTVKQVRVFQPSGHGRADRPQLMWVGEIAVNRP